MSTPPTSISTLGDLKRSGYRIRGVKDEMRENLVKALQEGTNLFKGIIGFDDTVLPQLQNAILGRHDIILLGLRGQAKSRLIRLLPQLLDEYIPVLKGSETNDDPFAPISRYGRDLVADAGDDAPVAWLHRSERYAEKLATPDTTMADLIGDIDPIKAATARLSYADERVIHFGIIPRSNRGIFAINELPDLQPRIQVGLLNVMEEQDVQIRGFNVRFPLDVMLIFSANPEDYTNRGSIITPLKDRIDSQIITHYPRTLDTGIQITQQEAWEERGPEAPRVRVPYFFRQIVEQIAREARQSEYVDQRSGVSVRMTRAAMEDLVSSAERRALLNGELDTTSRLIDLLDVEPAITGKVELVYEGEQEGAQNVARLLTVRAVKTVFSMYFPDPTDKKAGRDKYRAVIDWFASGQNVAIERDWPFDKYSAALDAVPGLGAIVAEHTTPSDPYEKATMMEFVLEALYGHSLIGKDLSDSVSRYSDMVGSMLSSFDVDDDEFDDDDFQGLN
ncbi:MAG: sigma 54-interacting transcriptional regulator [Bacteroidetes bacterium]|nr:sigma 54-interacting transcriptional regulator [Bacteroidota bacterium]